MIITAPNIGHSRLRVTEHPLSPVNLWSSYRQKKHDKSKMFILEVIHVTFICTPLKKGSLHSHS